MLRRGVEVPDALVVAGSPGVRDVHGTAAVGVEREGPDAAGEAAGEREDEDSSNGAGASSQITLNVEYQVLNHSCAVVCHAFEQTPAKSF